MTGPLADVLPSEWLKIRSLQSSRYFLAATAGVWVLGVAVAVMWARFWDGLRPGEQSVVAADPDATVGVATLPFLQLCFGIFGVLVITAEYGSGTISASLTAVPRRRVLFAGKAVVVGILAFTAGIVVMTLTYFASVLILGDRPFAGYAAPFTDEIPGLFGAGLSVAVVALAGLGVGTLLRSTAGGLSAVVALLYLAEMLPQILPSPWNEWVRALLLPHLTERITGAVPDGLLSIPGVLAAFAAYLLVTLGFATSHLNRRDA
ncbi:ABC transporter permease [Amycolatopsis nigrescens]|uniref:ABC transporter permease n=1 Tax=Amycolatopsis nigrescens TaxID=381445 RepID=UPI00035CB67B|nr:ABC transporter permease [Amycolatopsis nigrescens]